MPDILTPDCIRYLVVHCSDTPDCDDLDASDIHAMHLGFGWNGIGYHGVITRDGSHKNGRPEYWVGAHVYGHNDASLGVCLIGRSDFTPPQMQALEALLRDWKSRYPDAEICGHSDFPSTEKTCPNFDVKAWAAAKGLG